MAKPKHKMPFVQTAMPMASPGLKRYRKENLPVTVGSILHFAVGLTHGADLLFPAEPFGSFFCVV